MSASDNLSQHQFTPAVVQGKQLPMFMTPHEVSHLHSIDYDMRRMHEVPEVMRSVEGHQQEKDALRGNIGSTALQRTAAETEKRGGIQRPAMIVHLPTGHTVLYDGHHRAVVSMESNRLLPVEHFTSHHEAIAQKDAQDHADVMDAARRKLGL